jgi:alcohol dehydrogenase (cytochrome c)
VRNGEHEVLGWRRAFAAASLFLASAAPAQGLFAGDPGGKFTAEQAAQGQKAYAQACASCHGTELEGNQFGPPLKGQLFQGHWRGRAQAMLSERIRTTMPPGRIGAVSGEAYADIEAYILQVNGTPPVAGPGRPASASARAEPARTPSAQSEAASAMFAPVQRLQNDPFHRAAMQAREETLAALAPVTDAMLQHPTPSDWLMWRRTYDGLGYSPLRQINRANVQRLGAVWSWALPLGLNEITPLVHDGVLFIYSGAVVQALDAASGNLLWQYQRVLPDGAGGLLTSHGKSLAIHDGKLFASTGDGHVIALETRTGHLIWDQEVIPSGPKSPGGGLQLNAGLLLAKGKVITGVSLGVGSGGGCYIVGLDAETGKESWRFHTIARPGQPGGDTWNGAPVEERFGAGVWTAGSYDPELDLVYFGVGNTYDTATLLEPRPGAVGLSPNDALYTDSTVALRPDTGALVWYYQHQKRDVWDLDWVFEQSIVTLPINGRLRKLVVTGGKSAMFDALDAASGEFVFSADLGQQNVVTAVDPLTGEKTVNPAVQPEAGKAKLLCPNSFGARSWPATAANPQTHILFVPILENCADYTYAPRSAALTAQGGLDMRFTPRGPPGHDGNFGQVAALDLEKRTTVWTHRQRMPIAGAALATAGGLLFNGDIDRYFYAYDQASGKVLWRTRLSASPESFPVTYAVKGRQYVAVVAGSGSPFGAGSRLFVPELLAPTAGMTLVVFALP